jgi:hypothetical protein
MMKARVVLSCAIAWVVVLTACSGSDDRPRTIGPNVSTGGVILPGQLLGLQVKPEDVSKQFEKTKRSYIASLGLFSLRENDLIRATLQVSRFNRLANPKDSQFRSLIIGRLGTTKPETLRIDNFDVYATSGTDQNIYAWFEGRGFFVLTTHRDYEFPRTLLRRIIESKDKLK